MPDETPEKTRSAADVRRARRAAALRENLRKRKQQARDRQDVDDAESRSPDGAERNSG